ncbi:hypothetical protein AAFF_G00189070 [Aldrovandia affinis]|uniref:Uncharacterized protein n=1 Tax=Aldrovandia affinis TaxID=143900 RepID=A0AAD7W6R5_9TELE|nr:hypothetical protein AAFF_G00189070 [Aldrovandia affinis]
MAEKITMDPSHEFELLPSGRQFRVLQCKLDKFKNYFVAYSIALLNRFYLGASSGEGPTLGLLTWPPQCRFHTMCRQDRSRGLQRCEAHVFVRIIILAYACLPMSHLASSLMVEVLEVGVETLLTQQ